MPVSDHARVCAAVVVLVTAAATVSFARADAPTALEDAAALEFTAPSGWVTEAIEGRSFRIVASEVSSDVMLVLPSEATSVDALRREMMAGMRDGDDTALTLIGDLHWIGDDGLAAEYQGMVQWRPARAFVIGRTSRSGAAIVVLATEAPAVTAAQRDAARELAASLVFVSP